MLAGMDHYWLVATHHRLVLTAVSCAARVYVWSGPSQQQGTRLGGADDEAPDISELELEDPDDEVRSGGPPSCSCVGSR